MRKEPTDLFVVHTTNADQEQLVLEFSSVSRDLAESVMIKMFMQRGFAEDLMLYNNSKGTVVCELLTNETLAARGWCQA